MWGLLSKIFIVVIIVLAFPTGLILASQNASPGDSTYSIKRGMEGVLSSLLSLNPITKAYFKTDLSNRRFKESIVLLNRNSADKITTNTSLVEMLNTTAIASADIKNVSDPALKKRLADSLSNQITTYRQSLSAVAKEKNQTTVTVNPTLTPTPIQSGPTSTPVPTKTQILLTPTPSLTPAPVCNDVIRNYSQCGGTTGFEKYPRTHLIMIAEHKNLCTNAIKNVVTNDLPLNFDCDPNVVGQCSADNIQACIDMLLKLQQTVSNPDIKNGTGSQANTTQGNNPIPTATLIPTSIPTPTITPTPTPFQTRKNAFQTLLERSEGTTSASDSAVETGATPSGAVRGISISANETILSNLINSFRSLISIFK